MFKVVDRKSEWHVGYRHDEGKGQRSVAGWPFPEEQGAKQCSVICLVLWCPHVTSET